VGKRYEKVEVRKENHVDEKGEKTEEKGKLKLIG
jgi:hypothetical protein